MAVSSADKTKFQTFDEKKSSTSALLMLTPCSLKLFLWLLLSLLLLLLFDYYWHQTQRKFDDINSMAWNFFLVCPIDNVWRWRQVKSYTRTLSYCFVTLNFVILLLQSALIPNNELSAYLNTLLPLYAVLYCS